MKSFEESSGNVFAACPSKLQATCCEERRRDLNLPLDALIDNILTFQAKLEHTARTAKGINLEMCDFALLVLENITKEECIQKAIKRFTDEQEKARTGK